MPERPWTGTWLEEERCLSPQTLCRDETATLLLVTEAGLSTSIPEESWGPHGRPPVSALRGPVNWRMLLPLQEKCHC